MKLKLLWDNQISISKKKGSVMCETETLNGEMREYKEDDLVCYCFHYTRKQIEEDYLRNGRSLILEKILSAKKDGKCDCAQKNPKGR